MALVWSLGYGKSVVLPAECARRVGKVETLVTTCSAPSFSIAQVVAIVFVVGAFSACAPGPGSLHAPTESSTISSRASVKPPDEASSDPNGSGEDGVGVVVEGARPRKGSAMREVPGAAQGSARQEASVAVALFQAPGVAEDAYQATERALQVVEGIALRRVTPEEVRAGALDAHDVVIFTGGRGSVQGKALGPEGREAVRRFVRGGGGYIGICAGAYMALQGEAEFHKIAIVAGRHRTGDAWIRGIATVDVEPTDGSTPLRLHYANGPLFEKIEVDGIEPYTVLAVFRSEIAYPRYGTHPGEMLGTPAVIASEYAAGRVVLFSPNPALGASNEPPREDLLIHALRWSTQRESLGARPTAAEVLGMSR